MFFQSFLVFLLIIVYYIDINIILVSADSDVVYYIISEDLFVIVGEHIGKDEYIIIPDQTTAKFLGFLPEDQVESLGDVNRKLKRKGSIHSRIYDSNLSPIEMFKKDINYFNNLLFSMQSLIIEESVEIINNSFQYLCIYPYDQTNILIIQIETNHNKFYDNSFFRLKGLNNLNNQLSHMTTMTSNIDNNLCIQNIRLIPIIQSELIITFDWLLDCKYGNKQRSTMGIAMIKNYHNNFEIESASLILPPLSINSNERIGWMPFHFQGKLYFIQSLLPFTIIIVESLPKSISDTSHSLFYPIKMKSSIKVYETKILSQHECSDDGIPYIFPNIYPSTPAIWIRNQFLAFYKAETQQNTTIFDYYEGYPLPNDIQMKHSSFGVFTFTNSTPFHKENEHHKVFKLDAISPWPITTKEFESYDNGLDLTPLSFWLEDDIGIPVKEGIEKIPTNTLLALSLGYNEEKTIVVRMNLDRLLNSLRILEC